METERITRKIRDACEYEETLIGLSLDISVFRLSMMALGSHIDFAFS
jgi:hypothetical protein